MRVEISEDELPREGDQDEAPWKRLVPEGHHHVRVRECKDQPWDNSAETEVRVTFQALAGPAKGAWVQQTLDATNPTDRARLGRLALAVGLDPAGFHTGELENRELVVRVKHSRQLRRDGTPWQNVVEYRALHADEDAASPDELEDLPF